MVSAAFCLQLSFWNLSRAHNKILGLLQFRLEKSLRRSALLNPRVPDPGTNPEKSSIFFFLINSFNYLLYMFLTISFRVQHRGFRIFLLNEHTFHKSEYHIPLPLLCPSKIKHNIFLRALRRCRNMLLRKIFPESFIIF